MGTLVSVLHVVFALGARFCRVDTAGAGCLSPRPELSRHPSPCGFSAQFMLSPGQAAGLGCLALLHFAKASSLTEGMIRPRSCFVFFPPSLLAQGKAVLLDQMSCKDAEGGLPCPLVQGRGEA